MERSERKEKERARVAEQSSKSKQENERVFSRESKGRGEHALLVYIDVSFCSQIKRHMYDVY